MCDRFIYRKTIGSGNGLALAGDPQRGPQRSNMYDYTSGKLHNTIVKNMYSKYIDQFVCARDYRIWEFRSVLLFGSYLQGAFSVGCIEMNVYKSRMYKKKLYRV